MEAVVVDPSSTVGEKGADVLTPEPIKYVVDDPSKTVEEKNADDLPLRTKR